MTPREVAIAFWQLMLARDIDAAMELIHPEYVEDYVQSGERIRGRANLRAIVENYPGGVLQSDTPPEVVEAPRANWVMTPGYTVVKVEESGTSGTAVVRITYPDQSAWWLIILFEVRDNMIYRQTTYFAERFDPPEWRAQWVEPIGPTLVTSG